MPPLEESLIYDEQWNSLYLPMGKLPLLYDQIPALLKGAFRGLQRVSEKFWEWQIINQAFTDKILIAHGTPMGNVSWLGFPALSVIEEVLPFLRVMSCYKKIFHASEDPSGTICPRNYLYRKQEPFCRVRWINPIHPDLFIHDNSIQEERNSQKEYTYRTVDAGYIYSWEKEIHLFKFNQISSDSMQLYLWLCPLVDSCFPKVEDFLRHYIETHQTQWPNVKHHIQDEQELNSFFKGEQVRRQLFCRGKKEDPGQNAELTILKDEDVLFADSMDAPIDFRQRKHYVTVAEGEPIAVKKLMKPAVPGLNLYGEVVPVEDTHDFKVIIKGPISESMEEDRILYVADQAGILNIKGNSLELKEVFVVEQHVDYHTGNIEFDKTVEIKGDVKAGFSVISGSDIIIRGFVEDGATIQAGGEILVLGGVVGLRTEIEAAGDVHLQFLQDATLFARGNIRVEKYVLRGSIYCSGKLEVYGKGLNGENRGAILGGNYSAFKGMSLHSLGANGVPSHCAVGHNLYIHNKIEKARQERALLERKQLSLMKSLPVDLTTEVGKKKLQFLKDSEKIKIKEILLLMKEVSLGREKISEYIDQQSLLEYCDLSEALPRIEICNKIFGDNEIEIGKISMLYSLNGEAQKEFILHHGQIYMESLSKKG